MGIDIRSIKVKTAFKLLEQSNTYPTEFLQNGNIVCQEIDLEFSRIFPN